MMCEVLGVSRSGYYSWVARARPTARELRDAERLPKIRATHAASRGIYGSPRVHASLRREGVSVGRERVARLMREDGLAGRVRRRFRVTTNSRHDEAIAANLVERDFTTETPDSVWCADITYIWTNAGFVYLAAIIDVATRLIVGWSIARHMRAELVQAALRNALAWRAPAKRLVHHSDRGKQYASAAYRGDLAASGIACSMSRAGDCYDNAMVESLFGTIKQEWINGRRWANLEEVRASLHDYIEVFYNRQRLHSSLDYRTPAEADTARSEEAAA